MHIDTDTPSLSSEDDAAIRAVVALADRAQTDPDVLLPLHTPGAAVVNFPGRRVLGREALAEAMRSALASPLQAVRTAVEVVDVRSVAHDVALVSCVKTVHDERPGKNAALPASRGALTYVMVRRDGSWLIAAAQTTPILG